MDFIYVKPNSLTEEFCSRLIQLFENSDYKYKGVTRLGLNLDIKHTTDLSFPLLPLDCSDNDLHEMNVEMSKLLRNEVKIYTEQFAKEKNCMIRYKQLHDTGFQMQKYDKGIGKFTYHNDFSLDHTNNSKRLLTYIWYINTVEEGGETVFGDDILIKPEVGKLVIFPSCWTYPHKGLVPVSDDKYIVTGWFYANDEDFLGNI